MDKDTILYCLRSNRLPTLYEMAAEVKGLVDSWPIPAWPGRDCKREYYERHAHPYVQAKTGGFYLYWTGVAKVNRTFQDTLVDMIIQTIYKLKRCEICKTKNCLD